MTVVNSLIDPLDDPNAETIRFDVSELIKRYADGQMFLRDTTHDRAVGMVPSTYDAEAHTVRVILATENPVVRFDWGTGQRYEEVMAMSRKHGDLSRLNASAPYLKDHDSRQQPGVWVPNSFKFEKIETKEYTGPALLGTVKFSSRPEVREGIEVDVAEGIRPNHSIGYLPTRVVKVRSKHEDEDGKTVLEQRRIAWLGFEGSNVAMGADNAAKTRSIPEPEPKGDPAMTPEEIKALVEETAAKAARESADAVHAKYAQEQEEASTKRTARDLAIRELSEAHELGDEFRDLYLDTGPRAAKTLDDFRSAAMTFVVERERNTPVIAGVRVEAGDLDERETWAKGAALCILDNAGYGISEREGDHKQDHKDAGGIAWKHMFMQHRNTPGDKAGYRLDERARQFKGLSVINIARMALARSGVSARELQRMPDTQVAKLALRHGNGGFSTIDSFGAIMTDTNNLAVNQGYNEAPRTFLTWGERRLAKDFRDNIEVGIGEMPTMPQVGEKNEIKVVHFTTTGETWAIQLHGARWGITFQAIVNDRTDLLIVRGQDFGASAARMQGDLFYGGAGAGEHADDGCLMGTENMDDGLPLFDDTTAGHRNHIELGGQSGTNVGPPDDLVRINDAGLLLGRQRGFNLDIEIDQRMRFLIVSRGASLVAHQTLQFVRVPGQVVTQATLAESTPDNDEWNDLEIVTERRIDASVGAGVVPPFFVAGPRSGLIYAFLEGMENVQVDSRSGWEVLGMEFRGMIPFGCGRRDFRGIVQVDGQ